MENRELEKEFNIAIRCVEIFALTFVIAGVLALPIVLSVFYSWWWFFLYPVYLIVMADRMKPHRIGGGHHDYRRIR